MEARYLSGPGPIENMLRMLRYAIFYISFMVSNFFIIPKAVSAKRAFSKTTY